MENYKKMKQSEAWLIKRLKEFKRVMKELKDIEGKIKRLHPTKDTKKIKRLIDIRNRIRNKILKRR